MRSSSPKRTRRSNDNSRKQERSRSKERVRKSPSKSSSSSEEKDSDNERRPVKKNFGLVRADGKKIDLKNKDSVKIYSKEELKAAQSSQKSSSWKKPETKRLNSEEIERKRLEMMDNAAWREKDREKAVKKYREEDEKEKNLKEFDKEFVSRQLKSAQSKTVSIESRIKSNLNNIQRSKQVMDSHFAKR